MPPIVIDLVIAVLILGLTYALSSEGLWGAALMFFNVMFAGIIAFNFYESLAALLAGSASFISGYADVLCLMGIFTVSLVMLRLSTETLAPSMVRFPPPVFHAGRLFFGFACAVETMAILLLCFYTAPVHKKVFTVIDYKYEPPFHVGIDHEWLGFFQYTTGFIFANHNAGTRDPYSEYGTAKVFDPKAEWLLRHQDARPYGEETVLAGETPPAGAEGAAGGAAPGGGGAAPVGGAPGMPTRPPGGSGAPN